MLLRGAPLLGIGQVRGRVVALMLRGLAGWGGGGMGNAVVPMPRY